MPSMFRSSLGCLALLLLAACSSGAGEGTQGVAAVPPGEVVPGADAEVAPDAAGPGSDAAAGDVDAGQADSAPGADAARTDAADAAPLSGASVSSDGAAAGYFPWQDGDPAKLYPYVYADRRPDGWVDVIFSGAPQGQVPSAPAIVLEYGPPIPGGPTHYTLSGTYLKAHPECSTEGPREYGQATRASGVDVTFTHATGHYGIVAIGGHGALQVDFDLAATVLTGQGPCP